MFIRIRERNRRESSHKNKIKTSQQWLLCSTPPDDLWPVWSDGNIEGTTQTVCRIIGKDNSRYLTFYNGGNFNIGCNANTIIVGGFWKNFPWEHISRTFSSLLISIMLIVSARKSGEMPNCTCELEIHYYMFHRPHACRVSLFLLIHFFYISWLDSSLVSDQW